MKNRPTKETLMKFARRHALDIDGYYQDEKERDPHKREIDAIVRQLKAVRKQRDSFRKQRDELINDISEIKRKAKAFNEIKEMINWFEDIRPCEFETQVVRVRRIIDDLERGAFNSHPNNMKLQREIVEIQEIEEEQ